MDTVVDGKSGVPIIILKDIQKQPYVQGENHQLWYKNVDSFTQIKPCAINLSDVLDYSDNSSKCVISNCDSKKCKTCPVLIKDTFFTSSLTRKDYYTNGYMVFLIVKHVMLSTV